MERLFRKRKNLLVCVFAIFFGIFAGAGSAVAAPNIKDENILQAVETEILFDEYVPSQLIDVSVSEGVVTLSGTIDNLLAKDRAVELAESIKGVKSVIDKITVVTPAKPDSELKADVTNALLLDPATDSYEIDVAANNGMVTLSGRVESWAEKNLADDVSKSVKGVKDVVNNISIFFESDRTDYEIKSEIERKLEMNAYINEALVEVKVDKAAVTLTGSVGSAREKNNVYAEAWVGGVKNVDNQLEVKWYLGDDMQKPDKFSLKSDTEIKEAIKDTLLYDPRTSSFNIDVEVNNGVANLRGTVDNLKAKNSAEQDALNTIGVWKVNNYLKVRLKAMPTDPEIEEAARQAILRDTTLGRYDFSVTVINGKAYLNGMVESAYEKRRAGDVVSGVYGIIDIQNRLKVNDRLLVSDSVIQDRIEEEFFWSVFVNSDEIDATVDRGVATLTGKADSWQEVNAAIANAFEAGARKVESRISVYEGTDFFPTYFYETFSHWPF